jgi:hypothetical protein
MESSPEVDMNTRIVSRAIPGIVVAALLCVAAAAPQAPQMPAPPPSAAPCTDYSHTGGGDSVFSYTNGDGVAQPLPAGFTVVGCSLSVHATYYTSVITSVREWDPTTLAPDPATVALRTETIYPSAFNWYGGLPWLPFVPPIITRSLLGVAEPPRTTVVVQVTSPSPSYFVSLTALYDPEGSADMPAASVVAAGGSHSTLQGSHPVVAHALCSGDDDLQSLRIAQSVRRTDVALDLATDEIVQVFRVAEPVDLRWIELAIGTPGIAGVNATTPEMPLPPPQPAVVGIVDPAGAPAPPTDMPQTLVEAAFPSSANLGYFISQTTPTWASHLDFDRTITLQPGRDYWLYVRAASSRKFLGRTLTGSEGGDFAAGVRALYTRGDSLGAWTPASDKVLAFKIVGRPAATTPVPARGAGFLMHVAPNPAGDVAQVTWSGAVGPVHFEVFDARGRRVGASEGGAAGTWAWGVTGHGGRPLPAGVYFVHARDSAGQRSVERVVVVR